MELLGTPTWFGSEKTPLLGWVNKPATGKARAAVVICPSFGKEHVSSYRTLRMLAEQLADAGFLVLRFDYAGTGDSAGDYHSPDQVELWIESVREAVAYVRAAGVASVALVGLRVGALLAAVAAQRCGPISQLVLWDPVVSGKSYLREQKALYRLSFGDGGEQDAADAFAPGLVFLPETARDLGALRLADLQLSAADVLLLSRPERQADALVALAARPDVEVVDATQQAELLDTSSQFSQVPRETIDVIADYLGDHAPKTAKPVKLKMRDEVTVEVTPDGQSIVEQFALLGPHQLFGIITTTNDATGSTIVCVNPAKEHRVGPARLWPELARAAAREGVRTVRFDRRGVGDSVHGDDDVRMYSLEAIEDMRDVVEATCPDQSDVNIVGLCSGAWVAMVGAIEQVHPRAVYLVNPALWRREPPSAHGAELGETQIAPPVQQQRRDPVLAVRRRLKQLMPYPVWLALGRLGKAKVPEIVLAPLVDAGVNVTIFYGTIDAWKFGRQAGWKAVRRLRSHGTMRVVVDSLIEHSLLTRPGRELVEAQVISEVAARGLVRQPQRAGSAPVS
jgi:pimeloyl-ACP methyl ester carboxylesterase